jgi:hypothetical protein
MTKQWKLSWTIAGGYREGTPGSFNCICRSGTPDSMAVNRILDGLVGRTGLERLEDTHRTIHNHIMINYL